MNKLALGTAQFGLDYGVSNQSGKINLSETKKIFKFAQKNRIDLIDTAISYGESEKIIGKFDTNEFKIITKLPSIPIDCLEIDIWLENHVRNSLKHLGIKSLYGVLLHNPRDILENFGKKLVDALYKIQLKGLINKIGLSIYDPSEFDQVLDLIKVDIIQAPLNIIDRRLEYSGWLSKLKSAGVEIHVRSIFLQGLLLMPRKKIPKKFERWSFVWDKWSSELKKNKFSAIEACLSYPLSLPEVDKVIVGVNSLDQFKEIIKTYQSRRLKIDLSFMESKDLMLINPYNWSDL